jgi:hypothetical protein
MGRVDVGAKFALPSTVGPLDRGVLRDVLGVHVDSYFFDVWFERWVVGKLVAERGVTGEDRPNIVFMARRIRRPVDAAREERKTTPWAACVTGGVGVAIVIAGRVAGTCEGELRKSGKEFAETKVFGILK